MMPAYFANMAPVLLRKLNILNYPVDFNVKIKGNPLLGKNKTYRGLFFGVLFALLIAYLQFLLYQLPFFSSISLYSYNDWLLMGFLLGFGALFGDLVKSLFKRRFSINPGQRFIPMDQLDYSVGALAFFSFYHILSLDKMLLIVVMGFFLHIIANHIAFYLKIRNEKW